VHRSFALVAVSFTRLQSLPTLRGIIPNRIPESGRLEQRGHGEKNRRFEVEQKQTMERSTAGMRYMDLKTRGRGELATAEDEMAEEDGAEYRGERD
jgi:hypothetical protein